MWKNEKKIYDDESETRWYIREWVGSALDQKARDVDP